MTTDDRGPAPQWPDASEWPSDDDSNRVWAQFYRDHFGALVFPMAGPLDVISHASSLARKAVAEYVDDHDEEPDDETRQAFWDDARETAEDAARGPLGYIDRSKYQSTADITDAVLDLWFTPLETSRGPRSEAHLRPICFLPGRSSKGLPLVLVDADVGHGDKEEADLDGPWGRLLPGPKAITPRGGLHTLMLSVGGERSSQGALAPGVDVVGLGGTPIPLPSGSLATPGRRWLDRSAPAPAPEELRKHVRRQHKRPDRPRVDREAGDDFEDDDAGHVAAILSSATGTSPGARNDGGKAIVGILARPRACPPDFVRACLELLVEEAAGRDRPSDQVREEMARWQHALTRGPRDEDFAADVLLAWIRVRDENRSPWTASKVGKFVRSLWKTSNWREGERAGAEDFSVGAPVSAWPTTAWGPRPEPPSPADAVPAAPPSDHLPAQEIDTDPQPPQEVPYPPPPPEVAQAAVEASKAPQAVQATWRGGQDPRTYCLSLGEAYTRDDLQRDLQREPIRIDAVMPAVDFSTGVHSTSPDLLTPPVRFGWGEHLAAAKRGLSAGDFLAVGASSAGAGKTTFLGWLMNGLGLQTAMRLLGVDGFADRPIVLPVWVSELPKKLEIYGRLSSSYLGFHQACLGDGPRAHEAAGVREMAVGLGMTPHELVAYARKLEDMHGNDERFPLCVARHKVIRQMVLSKLPRHSRRAGIPVHHRSGPDLIDHVADGVDYFRRELAALAGVTTDKVLPVVIIDPVQRFAGEGESEKRAIDAILGAANEVLCGELECVVVTTNDTTKAAARGVSLDTFLSAEAPALMADVFAGSQGIIHHASDVIAVHPERADPARPGRRRQWARLLKCRDGGEPPVAFPFDWLPAVGRLMPLGAEPLRPQPEQDDRHRGGGERGGRGERDRPAPRPFVPDGIRLPPLRGRHAEDLPD